MDQTRKKLAYAAGFILLVLILIGIPLITVNLVEKATKNILSPVEQANMQIKTQVSEILHPTPTIIPDPVSIVHEIRSLARLETIQYTIEKVITAEQGQGQFGFLFGDKLLFIARGIVVAGIDLNKLEPEDLNVRGNILYVHLPEPEIFITTLDNEKSYVYDRETGLLTKGDKNLETNARKVAEEQIAKTAIEDGILTQAKNNSEIYLSRMLLWLGYSDVIFTFGNE